MILRSFRNGEPIYRRGEVAASAFQLREGRIRLSWPDQDGLEVSTVLGGGQVFGAAELISGEARSATAEALGDVVASELGRDELARLLADDPGLIRAVFRPVFERLRRDEEAARIARENREPPAAAPFEVSALSLKPEGRELLQQMDADGVRIATLPFRVGRQSARAGHGGDRGAPIELALHDTRPYSLSRRHFAIETLNGGYVVRDCGSHHGTIVNGSQIGGKLTMSIAPLVRGENRIVAGRSLSPFRFTLTIEGG